MIMKKRLLFAGTLVLFIATFNACKKQDEATKPLRDKLVGKWQVNKVQTVNGTSDPVSVSYTSSDYMDFKESSNDFELSLGTNRSIGTYSSTLGDMLYLDFTTKDLDAKVNVISNNQLQFTGTVVGSNPKITETYYLSR